MTINGFWQIIDACASESNRDAQLSKLQEIIRSLPLEDYQDFSDHFSTECFKLTQNDTVVNAAYLVFEQCLSQDMLYYFSWWLVSLGEQACAHLIEDPDMILDLLKTHIDPNYEEFGAVMNCRTNELPQSNEPFPSRKIKDLLWSDKTQQDRMPRLHVWSKR